MYIEYIRNQRGASKYGDLQQNSGIDCRLEYSEVPEFKPTWLVRVSDMQVVPGVSINQHYWALSYSWNQSGELIHKGGEDYSRIDKGQHQITEYRPTKKYTIRDPEDFEFFMRFDTDFDPETASTKSVTFEGLVQQICKDFGISYIWFDQMCINQKDHDAKMQEIKQMHLVYKNARCTLALIPELRYTFEGRKVRNTNVQDILSTQWCKRIWTLEEAYVSKNIVFLGHNVYIQSDISLLWDAYTGNKVFKPINLETQATRKWAACTALWYSRKRTSSKAHDRIFALANIFPEIMSGITFSYKQPLLKLIVQFYRILAQRDISTLLFGAPINSDLEDEIAAARQREASLLPSWTGIVGAHIAEYALKNKSPIAIPDYTITDDCMRITTSFITARIAPTNAIKKPDGFDDPRAFCTTYDEFLNCVKIISNTTGDDEFYSYTEDGLPVESSLWYNWSGGCIAENAHGSTDLMFVATTNKSHQLHSFRISGLGLKATHVLPVTLEDKIATNTLSKPTSYCGVLSLTQECNQCIILSEPAFGDYSFTIYPVIKKEKDGYKSIGVFLLDRKLNITSLDQPKQTFHVT